MALASDRLSSEGITVMSYSQAVKLSRLVTFYDGVIAQEQAAFLNALVAQETASFYKAVQARQQQEAAQAAQAAALASYRSAGSSADATSTNTADWACIRFHESRDNYTDGNGGAYQFEYGTWHAVTGLPNPAEDYPPSVQDAAALRLYAERGWKPWTTRYVCGL
jgi:muramidase (phage lysozyme)